MTNTNIRNIGQTVLTIACTIVCSSVLVLSAVAPGQAMATPTHQIAAQPLV